MKAVGRYDSALQMFVDEPRPLNLNRLGFLRWLAERGLIDGAAVHGPAAGPLVGEPAAIQGAWTQEEPV